MWRNASEEEKAPFQEQELRERVIYKENIKKFKDDLLTIKSDDEKDSTTILMEKLKAMGIQTENEDP